MVDDNEILKQYSYKATSNLVLEQDRRRRRDRGRERDGSSLAPLDAAALPGRMGDRASREGQRSPELQARLDKLKATHAGRGDSDEQQQQPQQPGHEQREQRQQRLEEEGNIQNRDVLLDPLSASGADDIVAAADELGIDATGAAYVPSTAVAQRAFDAILAFVLSKLGDYPRDILREAATESLAWLKDDSLVELDRKKEISKILGKSLSPDEFARLSMLGRQINDYRPRGEDELHGSSRGSSAANPTYVQNAALAVGVDAGDELDGETGAPDEGDFGEGDFADEVVELEDDAEDQDVIPNLRPSMLDKGDSQGGIDSLDKDGMDSDGNGEDEEDEAQAAHPDWLPNQLMPLYPDSTERARITKLVRDTLISPDDDRTVEYRLAELLQFDQLDLVDRLLRHRDVLLAVSRGEEAAAGVDNGDVSEEPPTKRKRTKSVRFADEESGGTAELENHYNSNEANAANGSKSYGIERDMGKNQRSQRGKSASTRASEDEHQLFGKRRPKFALRPLDLEALTFTRGGRVLAARECSLPPGSQHVTHQDHEEWHLPAVRATEAARANVRAIPIDELPEWAQKPFSNTLQLNRMQSTVFPAAFTTDENLLVCAPTGAGKTNVAVLTVLRAIRSSAPQVEAFGEEHVPIALKGLKVVYVAPMKALVAEVAQNLGKRLEPLGLKVRELTGDVGLTRFEVEDTHVIVTTPEKWDIITRKAGEKAFARKVSLVIIDEIHLLHDDRGPVLESIVARTLRSVDSLATFTRVIGLSATLPNYKDVATFLRVDPDRGLFYFDPTHRPCPLRQTYVGITSKKALKRFQLMNELTYGKVKTQLENSNQVIVFVHSRKETTTTCQYIIDKSIEEELSDLLLRPGSGSHEIIRSELPDVASKDLAALLEHGLATHHAGMTRSDRQLVESLFENGHVKVLVSTATLAWGVNLPAHSVVIKGTQVYSPEHGQWIELSSMDVMQMMGRAGRPQFDTYGEGYIITTKTDVLYYLSLLNDQLPIESQFVARLVDMLNAEVASGSVSSVTDGVNWLSYTYLYVRMVKNGALYGIAADERSSDPTLERRRAELIHAAARELHRCGLVKYSERSGDLTGTELGKVAADFYVGHESMAFYIDRMSPTTTDIDLFRIFSGSTEFKHMHVREEEKLELARLAERVPIPVKESLDEPTAKVNVLLQAYISNLSLTGLAMKADMVYVTQSAARLSRALLQISLHMQSVPLFERCLSLCKNVSSRQWSSQTPLRQFQNSLGTEVIHKIERKDYPFERYYDLDVSELGELVKDVKLGKRIHRFVHSLPRLEMEVHVRPISRSSVEVELNVLPDFRYERKIHGGGELFWITVEDADSENLLHAELFYLRASVSSAEHTLCFTLPIGAPLPPQYFIRCSSDRWLVPETVLPISFRHLILPEKLQTLSKPTDMEPMPVSFAFDTHQVDENEDDILDLVAFREAMTDCTSYFSSRFPDFSPFQSQLLPTSFESRDNTFLASVPDFERDLFGELCIARLFTRQPTSVAIWICGKGTSSVNQTVDFLAMGIGKHLGLKVGPFLSDRAQDLAFLRSAGTVAVTSPEVWDMFSRRWREKRVSKLMKKIGLFVLDGIQVIAEKNGSGVPLEVVGSRLRYIAADLNESGLTPFRIVALSDPIANAKEVGHWLGCPPHAVHSFHPKDICKEVKVEVVSNPSQSGRRELDAPQAAQHVLSALRTYIADRNYQGVVYVSSRGIARNVALELVGSATLSGKADRFLISKDQAVSSSLEKIQLQTLKDCLKCGVAFLHDGLSKTELDTVQQLFSSGVISVVIVSLSMAWTVRTLDARLTVIAINATEQWGSSVTRRALYNQTDLMRMMFGSRRAGERGGRPNLRKRMIVFVSEPGLASHYRQHLLDPPAVESQLPRWLADHLNAEIAAGVIESKQDAVDYLTWTFFYRRLSKNPNFYGMKGTSHTDISNLLSEKVETVLSDLETSKCVATEGDEDVALGALNLGIIASHYYLRYATVELFSSSIAPNTRVKGLLDIVSLASEFESVPVRIGEEEVLQTLGHDVPVSLQEGGHVPSFTDPHVKTHVLLQTQMTRMKLPTAQLSEDRKRVVRSSVHLLKALVDVISSAGWLKPALDTIELMRMLVQGMWQSDSPLMQLPHVEQALVNRLKDEFDVQGIFDFLDLEPEQQSEVLQGLSENAIMEMDAASKRFPSLKDIEIEAVQNDVMDDGVTALTTVTVIIERVEEEDDDEEDGERDAEDSDKKSNAKKVSVPQVSAPRFVQPREEGWWVIVGDERSNSLLTVKHVLIKQKSSVKLQFSTPEGNGKQPLRVYLISDSYIDCDQEDTFEVDCIA